MNKIFQNKRTAFLIVCLTLVLVLLVCVLVTMLMQYSALTARAETLSALIDKAMQDTADADKLWQYMQTDEYVYEWARNNGKLTEDQINWVVSQQN